MTTGWPEVHGRPARVAAGVGLAALTFYLLTLAPDLVWGDGARLQTDAITGTSLYWQFDELAGVETDGYLFDRLGVAAWDHPLWVMVGHAVTGLPAGNPNYLLNLLSAVPAALALALLAVIGQGLGLSVRSVVIGCGALAVSHTYWLHAVTAEVYALHGAFMVLLLWLTLRFHDRPSAATAVALAAATGLGLANHLILGLTVVVLAGFLLATRRGWWPAMATRRPVVVAMCAVVFVVGFMPWWVQFLRMARVAGLDTTWSMAWGFPWLGTRWPGPVSAIPGNIVGYVGLLIYQFTPVGVGLGLLGARMLWRRNPMTTGLILILFVTHAAFSANYDVADRFAFHLPSYVMFALFLTAGVDQVLAWFSLRRDAVTAAAAVGLVVVPLLLYTVTPGLLRSAGVDDADLGIPAVGVDGRDGLDYYLNPNASHDRSAPNFGRDALSSLETDALVFAAWPFDLEPYIAMRHYQLTEDRRRDVTLEMFLFTSPTTNDLATAVLESAALNRGCRPLYLASLNPDAYPLDALAPDFDIQPGTHLFRLTPTGSAADGPAGDDPDCHSQPPPATTDLAGLLRGIRQ